MQVQLEQVERQCFELEALKLYHLHGIRSCASRVIADEFSLALN